MNLTLQPSILLLCVFWNINAVLPGFAYWTLRLVGVGGCSSYLLAPVQTIFPELNMRAVVLGSRILIMTAANLCTQKPKGQLASARVNTILVEKLSWT